ncbi:polygalacturonase 11c [Senna tora]|uniref:Polygalacturonase 11c n=1 Tax=Senna tora TaxID=362788 RepID=A0A834SQ46_9FABA|nr:polygalacturonase 11c [Senna tora]
MGCNNVTFANFTINAPATSPKTDGIHIGRSSEINIIDSFISTGDDCISLGDGSRKINILRVTCGPGHGISVRSLGKFTYEEPVEGFIVKNCTFRNTDNGVRIKTWPGAPGTTTVSDLQYEDIIMVNVSNPIIIEQDYCPYIQCSRREWSVGHVGVEMEKNVNETNDEETLVIYHDDNIASEIDGCKCSLLTKVILFKRIIYGPLQNALHNMWNSLARFRVEEIGRQFYQCLFADKTKMEKVLEGAIKGLAPHCHYEGIATEFGSLVGDVKVMGIFVMPRDNIHFMKVLVLFIMKNPIRKGANVRNKADGIHWSGGTC